RRRPVGLTGRVPDAAHRLADRTEPGLRRAWAGLPEARDVHEHNARVHTHEIVVREAEAGERAGLEVLEHDVAVRGDAPYDVLTGRRAQVELDRPLVASDRRPPEAAAVDAHAVAPHDVAAGRFDLHHVGAEIAEQLARERARDERAELEHTDPGERRGRIGRARHGQHSRVADTPRSYLRNERPRTPMRTEEDGDGLRTE